MVTHLDKIGVSEDKVGSIFFAAGTASLAVSVLVFFYFKNFPRRLAFILAMFGFFVSSLMIGPSTAIRLPDTGFIIATGIIIQGIVKVFTNIPIFPEMIQRLQVELEAKEG